MQKKIIALAVAGLVSGAAFAQSNVTIYGVADVGIAKVDGKSLAASANGTANNGSSRLGFKGSEDLGGGLKANFTMEEQINLANGAVGSATDANPFYRQAWVGLSGGFGEVQIGQNYSGGFKALGQFETSQTANYSPVLGRFGATGGTRNAAQVLYMTPSMGGFTVAFGHVLKGNMATDKAQNELAAWYNNGPIAVGLGYADNGDGLGKDKMVGGSFNFGMGRAVAGYYDPAGDKKGYSLGVADVKLGPVLLALDYAKNTAASMGKPRTTMLEVKYPMSKRTFVYANYLDYTEANSDFWGAGIRHNF